MSFDDLTAATGLLDLSDDADAEADSRVDRLGVRVPRVVAEGRNPQLIGRGVGNPPVVVPPVADVGRWRAARCIAVRSLADR
jgi:hypothetical protein